MFYEPIRVENMRTLIHPERKPVWPGNAVRRGIRQATETSKECIEHYKYGLVHDFCVWIAILILGKRSLICGIHYKPLTHKAVSPLQFPANAIPTIGEIVTFGSPFTDFREPWKKTFAQPGLRGVFVGIGDTTNGYHVYLPNERVVITTQRVKNIDTLCTNSMRGRQIRIYCETRRIKQPMRKMRHPTPRKIKRAGEERNR